MSSSVHTAQEIERLGSEFGHDLAAALVLASSRTGDRGLTREMSGIVLRQIAAAVRTLEEADFPAELTAAYEHAARAGVRAELMKSRAVAERVDRRAA